MGALIRFAGFALLLALTLVALGLVPASALDRGPSGGVRLSWLPIALAMLDPYVLRCARNSAILAAAVAAGSTAVGVGLGAILSGRRFWGRPILATLTLGPMAAGALLIAPGVAGMLGGSEALDWLAARSAFGYSCEDVARWSALAWVGLASGVPLVILATTSALARVEPAWADSARAHGAGRLRIWLDLTWPVIRPEVARASAAVFAFEVAEPVGPAALGLRRTLAAQMVEAARRFDEPTRAATIALVAVAVAALGRALILRSAGRPCLGARVEPPAATPAAGRGSALARSAIVAAWVAFALGPAVATLGRAFGGAEGAGAGSWARLAVAWLGDPEARGWALNSAATAGLAVILDLAILAAFTGRGSRRAARAMVATLATIPPLAFAVGALATPWLLSALADRLHGLPSGWARGVALELGAGRSPGLALAAVLAATRLPMLLAAADLARGRSTPALQDAARLAGLSTRRARRAGDGLWLGLAPAGPTALALALAATNLAPALLLTSFSERRALAPAAFSLILGGQDADPRLAGMLAAIVAANLLGFLVASRSRVGPLGDWSRG